MKTGVCSPLTSSFCETRDLTPLDGVQAQVQEVSYKFPDEVLVGLNDRDPQLHDLYRVDVRSGERTLGAGEPGLFGDYH